MAAWTSTLCGSIISGYIRLHHSNYETVPIDVIGLILGYFDLWTYIPLDAKQLKSLQSMPRDSRHTLIARKVILSRKHSTRFEVRARRFLSFSNLLVLSTHLGFGARRTALIYRSKNGKNSSKESFEQDCIEHNPRHSALRDENEVVLPVAGVQTLKELGFFCFIAIDEIQTPNGQTKWEWNGTISGNEDSDDDDSDSDGSNSGDDSDSDRYDDGDDSGDDSDEES